MLSFATGPQTVTEGGGPVTVCAALGLPSGKSLGCDISVPFRGVSGERGSTSHMIIYVVRLLSII